VKPAPAATAADRFDAERLRADFPALQQSVHGKPLVYLDNAATTQKPRSVIEALRHYYERDNSNVHRGVHALSERATAAYEGARDRVRAFLNAAQREEIIFTRGTTESINLVAQSFLRPRLRPGDEILITGMEHHSNIVPWQLLCEQTGAVLKVVPITDDGELVDAEFERLLNRRTRLLGVVQVSNALGTVNPVARMIQAAHAQDVPVLVDGAQAVAHLPVDVRALDADFYVFSSHKIFGPTGLGVLYAKRRLLEDMPPYQGGGDMILTVSFEKSIWNALPYKFEAGTPHIAGAIGLGAALDYVESVGLPGIAAHEHALLAYATDAVRAVKGLRLIGTARDKAGILSFVMDGVHPHDIGTIVDAEGVAIRTGHHCAMPVMERFGVPATARASFALYNTRADVDALVRALHRVNQLFAA
jgi:cysteine desulfurase / selenocysteine lyase